MQNMNFAVLLAEMNYAFAVGEKAGMQIHSFAGDCLIDHESLMLRMSWMNGFTYGRQYLVGD